VFRVTGCWDEFGKENCFVANGPLLRVRASGMLPGAVFSAEASEPLGLELKMYN
jgi:hypothetical protein